LSFLIILVLLVLTRFTRNLKTLEDLSALETNVNTFPQCIISVLSGVKKNLMLKTGSFKFQIPNSKFQIPKYPFHLTSFI